MPKHSTIAIDEKAIWELIALICGTILSDCPQKMVCLSGSTPASLIYMSEAVTPDFEVADLVNPKVEINIPKGSINEFPLQRYEGQIVLVQDDSGLEAALQSIAAESILGFDTESRPVFRRGQSYPPALLQLAGAQCVWLFQLKKLKMPEALFAVLSDTQTIKVGVAIRDDIRKLQEIRKFEAGGFVEIADFTQKAGIVNTGLRSLAAIFLKFRISKGAQVSNWSRSELSPSQIQYAATDAWVSRELFLKLREVGLAPEHPVSLHSTQKPRKPRQSRPKAVS